MGADEVGVEPENPAGPQGQRHLRSLVLAAILLAAAVVRLVLFVGIRRLDMFRYLELSNHVLSGGSLFSQGVFFASRRLALMLPLIASNRIAGFGEHVSVAWPLLCSLGSVAVVFLLAEEVWDWRVGALAGAGMALYPLEVELGTQLLPDPIAGFFIVLAVYFAVLAVRRDAHAVAYAILSGAAIGVVFFARENGLVFLPGLMLVGLLLEPSRWKRTLWTPLGALAVVAAAGTFFWIAYGHPLIDWIRFQEFYAGYDAAGFVQPKTTYLAEVMSRRAFDGLAVVVVLALVGAIVGQGRGRWVMLLWAVGFPVFLIVLGPLLGMNVDYRYAEPAIPPLLILAAVGVHAIGGRVGARGPVMVGAALALLLLLPSARAAVRTWTESPRWIAIDTAWDQVKRSPDSIVFVDDPYVLTALNYFSRFSIGRDSLAAADDPVNADARLFRLGERPIREQERTHLVVLRGLPAGMQAEQKAHYDYGSGNALRVFEVTH